MPDGWHRRSRALTQAVRIYRHFPPADQRQAVPLDGFGHDRASPRVPLEKHGDRELSAEEAMRDLDQESGAISALAVGIEPAPVRHPGHRLHPDRGGSVAELRRGHE